MNDNLITYSRNIVAFFTRIFYAFLCFLHVSLWHDLPPQTIWMNGDVAVAPLVFFRPFSVGFSFIRVSLEFAFTFCILHLTHMTYYSMTLFCLHKPFGSVNEFWWLVLVFFVPLRLGSATYNFLSHFCILSEIHT